MGSHEPSSATGTLPDSPRPDVIVVDDDPPIVETVCEILADHHIAAASCPLGWTAQQCIRQQQPKVVMLDVQMPAVSGIELFYLLRSDPKTRHIPVIFFTANPAKVVEEIPNFRAMAAELLPKPFHMDKLLELVGRSLAN